MPAIRRIGFEPASHSRCSLCLCPLPLLRQGVQRFAFHRRELFSARPSRTKLEGPRADSGMREVERCTDVTNAVVGEADGAPCWQSERHRFGWGWRGEVLRSYCADVIDGRPAAGWATRFLNSRFDSGCFV